MARPKTPGQFVVLPPDATPEDRNIAEKAALLKWSAEQRCSPPVVTDPVAVGKILVDEVQAARARTCARCAWSVAKATGENCTHPTVTRMRADPYSGEVTQDYVKAWAARQPGGQCGPDGRLFIDRGVLDQDKPQWQLWLRRLRVWDDGGLVAYGPPGVLILAALFYIGWML